MEYTLINGTVVNDDDFERMAAEFESGQWEGHLENVVVGVPRPDEEEQTVVSFRLPKSRIKAIEAAISARGMSKSDFYRCAVDRELLAIA